MKTRIFSLFGLGIILTVLACAHYPAGDDDDTDGGACTGDCPPDGGNPPDGGMPPDGGPPDGPPPECVVDDDCGCGEICTDGSCTMTSCCSDDDCPDGQVCDTDTGTCGDPPPDCRLIRFTTPLEGVDGNTGGWSSDDSLVDLGASSWPLLGGTADVYAWSGSQPGKLTHRGTRGLGVRGGEQDEIDNVCYGERIKVKFDDPVCIRYVEARSLFSPDVGGGPAEEGAYALRLGGASAGGGAMSGVQPYGSSDGIWSASLPYVEIDRIDFYVPDDAPSNSEFALAALEVCACD